MTLEKFLQFVFKQTEFVMSKPYSPRYDLDMLMRSECSSEIKADRIVKFFKDIGNICFSRIETNSGDKLHIEIKCFPRSNICEIPRVFLWEKPKKAVVIAVEIRNCSGIIEHIFISEDCTFYNDKQHLIASNAEELFDYLSETEYDFHPKIEERTIEILRCAGWFENRRVNIDEDNRILLSRDVKLTQQQLDFFSEFGGLNFQFDDGIYDFEIADLHRLLDKSNVDYEENVRITDSFIVENLVENICSRYSGFLSLTSDGILLNEDYNPLGRTALECINHLINDIPDFVKLI